MAKVEKTPGGCWLWLGELDNEGYAYFWADRKRHRANRWSYEHFNGPIPDGLVVDHQCTTPPCVNPTHLRPMTQAENVQRWSSLITHCPAGHQYTPENTYVHRGKRHCRECVREHKRQWRARQRA